jgi:hypothetical protein
MRTETAVLVYFILASGLMRHALGDLPNARTTFETLQTGFGRF